jgi:hypothetical protein
MNRALCTPDTGPGVHKGALCHTFSHKPRVLPSVSLKYANAPMPGISCLGRTMLPPAASTRLRASSTDSTLIVMTGEGVS